MRVGSRLVELTVEVMEHLADRRDVVQIGAADDQISSLGIDHEIESTHRKARHTGRGRVRGASDPSIPAVSLPRGARTGGGPAVFLFFCRVLAIAALWA